MKKSYSQAIGGQPGTSSGSQGQKGTPWERINAVRLNWVGEGPMPKRDNFVPLIMSLGYGAADIGAIVEPPTAVKKFFDVSFRHRRGLENFWGRYKSFGGVGGWVVWKAEVITPLDTTRKVTILLPHEAIPLADLKHWISNFGDVIGPVKKQLDRFGIWGGGVECTVKFKTVNGGTCHMPSSAFIGRDRLVAFYQGQPKNCHKCNGPGHMAFNCPEPRCSKCQAFGHAARDCKTIKCNLCFAFGHSYVACPEAWSNLDQSVKDAMEGPMPGEADSEPRKAWIRVIKTPKEAPGTKTVGDSARGMALMRDEDSKGGGDSKETQEDGGGRDLQVSVREGAAVGGHGKESKGKRVGGMVEKGGKKKKGEDLGGGGVTWQGGVKEPEGGGGKKMGEKMEVSRKEEVEEAVRKVAEAARKVAEVEVIEDVSPVTDEWQNVKRRKTGGRTRLGISKRGGMSTSKNRDGGEAPLVNLVKKKPGWVTKVSLTGLKKGMKVQGTVKPRLSNRFSRLVGVETEIDEMEMEKATLEVEGGGNIIG